MTNHLLAHVIASAVKAVLVPDMAKSEYRGEHPLSGLCYVASEAIYHLLDSSEWHPKRIAHEGVSHWFLQHDDGTVIDITHDQFETPVPHEKGKGCGFMTKEPSKRARKVIEDTYDIIDFMQFKKTKAL